jgi:hypothetical protein
MTIKKNCLDARITRNDKGKFNKRLDICTANSKEECLFGETCTRNFETDGVKCFNQDAINDIIKLDLELIKQQNPEISSDKIEKWYKNRLKYLEE